MSNTNIKDSQQPFAHLNKFLAANEDYREENNNADANENQWLSNEQEKNIFKKCKTDIKAKGYI